MSQAPLAPLQGALRNLDRFLKVAKKNDVRLASHAFYSVRVRGTLANLRKAFVALQLTYPADQYPGVAYRVRTIEPLVQRLVSTYPNEPAGEMLRVVREIQFTVESDLAAELEQLEANKGKQASILFLPDDIFDRRYGILNKVLWEANTSYASQCYNASATMLRRIIETLIIEAFEAKKIGSKLRTPDGDYLTLKKLVDKAVVEPQLKLTGPTKRLLPKLKFFGDLGAHNRLVLVRKGDLDALHDALRTGLEELATHLP